MKKLLILLAAASFITACADANITVVNQSGYDNVVTTVSLISGDLKKMDVDQETWNVILNNNASQEHSFSLDWMKKNSLSVGAIHAGGGGVDVYDLGTVNLISDIDLKATITRSGVSIVEE